jgi:hypothetical protein
MALKRVSFRYLSLLAIGCALGVASVASAQSVRIVTYNIEADTNGNTLPNAGLYDVLKGIGQQSLNGIVQPLDILAMQETTSNAVTIAPIVTDLNNYYNSSYTGPSVYKPSYAVTPVQASQSGGTGTGNGPNSLIYNSNSLQLVASVGVGTYQGASNGVYRQVMRYEFKPKNSTLAEDFYVYVTHAKANSGRTTIENETFRNSEMTMIRANANSLVTASNPNPKILYVGDFNFLGSAPITDGTTTAAAYQTITGINASTLPVQTAGIDPFNTNPQNNNITWGSSTYKSLLTESADHVTARFDYQFMTSPVYAASSPFGLKYVPQSQRAFGNNGTTSYGGSVSDAGNTALNNLVSTNNSSPIPKSTIYTSLTTASDHLPVVGDYFELRPGDFNLDGVLTKSDLSAMLGALTNLNTYRVSKGMSTADLLAVGDLNRDGVVSNFDIQSLVNAIAAGAGAIAAVPEPASIVLLAIAAMAIVMARGRKRRVAC